MKSIDVIDIFTGKKLETIDIPEKIVKYFDYKNPEHLIHEVVTAYLSNQRQGTHSTKTRAEVRGGGKKPWRQKHTGRARAGSVRSPLWRKGGIVFGPKPRDYYINIPKKKKCIAKYISLADKIKSNNLVVAHNLDLSSYKTKEMVKILKNLNFDSEKVLLVDTKIGTNLKLATRNLPKVESKRISDINTYDILNHTKIVISKEAFLCL